MCSICLKDGHRAASCPQRPGIRLAGALVALMLAGCETPAPIAVKGDSYCKLGEVLTWVPADTPKTIHGIRRANAKYNRICRRPLK